MIGLKNFIIVTISVVIAAATLFLLDGVIPDQYLRYVVLGVGFFGNRLFERKLNLF